MAAAKALLVMVGGAIKRDPIKRCQPVFETYARERGCPSGSSGGGAGRQVAEQRAVHRTKLGLAASTFSVASSLGVDVDALINVLKAGSARSYAAEVIANSGRSLSVMAELAGPLLAKDVSILAAAVGANSCELLQMATATIAAMDLHNSVKPSAQ